MFGLYFLRYSDPGRDDGLVDGGAAAVPGAAEPSSRSLAGVGGRRGRGVAVEGCCRRHVDVGILESTGSGGRGWIDVADGDRDFATAGVVTSAVQLA